MDRHDFVQSLLRAKKGARVRYHTGLLMNDRVYNVEVEKIARTVWNLYEAGKCTLVQQRMPEAQPSACHYYAVRT